MNPPVTKARTICTHCGAKLEGNELVDPGDMQLHKHGDRADDRGHAPRIHIWDYRWVNGVEVPGTVV